VSSGTSLKNGRLQKYSPDDFYGLVEFLNIHEIDIKNYCGKSCDNASAMSGRYNGFQAKEAAENNLAI